MNKQGQNIRKSHKITHAILAGVLLLATYGVSRHAEAGVALGATRVIYPAGQKQVQLAVTNSDNKSAYLIQSWVENADGKKMAVSLLLHRCFRCKAKREYTAHY